ncbi:hypothetical protein WR51_29480 (plasmid) [Bacillus cereus]|nr:hypothetical protein WR47_29185 [Bacillus cereus]ANC17058.1 hypothetical protein WR51_29480 [Bacillus cereus]
MEKSQGNLQNNVHLHDIVENIKELANPLWISSVSLLQAHNQNFKTKATTFMNITISDLRDLKVSLSLIYAARKRMNRI